MFEHIRSCPICKQDLIQLKEDMICQKNDHHYSYDGQYHKVSNANFSIDWYDDSALLRGCFIENKQIVDEFDADRRYNTKDIRKIFKIMLKISLLG